METGSKTGVVHLAILSLSVGAMLIASLGSPAQHGLATSSGTSNYTALEEKNKALVLEAFDTLFNQRDYVVAERYWSPEYIQHSAHIAPGREGLFNLVKSNPPTLRYEPGTIVADGDFVIVHGRFSGFGQPANWIAADILRIEDGLMVEHWDVIQDEVTKEQSKSGMPMFGAKFPE
jgi:predicted SnoaL-like aldol condensation-catalyzing enzyme